MKNRQDVQDSDDAGSHISYMLDRNSLHYGKATGNRCRSHDTKKRSYRDDTELTESGANFSESNGWFEAFPNEGK
jgi:hypothetical protein